MKVKNFSVILVCFVFTAGSLAGCTVKSYPADEVKDAVQKITREEYGIDNVQVKFSGNTIGVYLPLDHLFSTDFKGSVVAGKVRNLETLFEPSPEALEKVEDVLFTISRVLLSTDRDIRFYVLQATDVENTGLQLVLKGHVDDVKRVRVWDISRGEYRKRVIHQMKQNRAVLWHAPVRGLFASLGKMPFQEIMDKYFENVAPDSVNALLFQTADAPEDGLEPVEWDIEEIRSARVQRGEVLVYAKVKPRRGGDPILPEDGIAQYLFLVSFKGKEPRITRVIPFQYLDERGALKKIPFPEDIQMQSSLETWEEEFPVEDIQLGDFLAEQMTRRIQVIILEDERIQNTFRELRVSLVFENVDNHPHYNLVFDAVALRDPNQYSPESMIMNEDMLYVLGLISKEFMEVTRSYKFGDYDYLTVNIADQPGEHIIGREDLELLRKKKIDLQGLLSPSRI